MSVRIAIVDGPLAPWHGDGAPAGEVGAAVVFEGIVRATGGGRRIEALEYEVYQPMAQRMIESICAALLAHHGLLAISVEHSRGRVAVGERSFRLVIWSKHRKEALAAADEFIDRLKRDVPIWKRETKPQAEGSSLTRPVV